VTPRAQAAGTAHVIVLGEDGSGSLLDRADAFGDTQQPVARGPQELAAITYTSGTTGRSKGALLTHGNLLPNARLLQDWWDWRPGDVLIHALPIFHVHGLFVAIHGALHNGSPRSGSPDLTRRRQSADCRRPPSHGRAHAVHAHAGRACADASGLRTHAPVHQRLGTATGGDLRRVDGPRRHGTVGPALPACSCA
jgi:acyl-CoA synthetase (AMP-forming)/AMP-acid ligase II